MLIGAKNISELTFPVLFAFHIIWPYIELFKALINMLQLLAKILEKILNGFQITIKKVNFGPIWA